MLTQSDDLPHQHTEAPDVSLVREYAVMQRFRCHPTDRQCSLQTVMIQTLIKTFKKKIQQFFNEQNTTTLVAAHLGMSLLVNLIGVANVSRHSKIGYFTKFIVVDQHVPCGQVSVHYLRIETQSLIYVLSQAVSFS